MPCFLFRFVIFNGGSLPVGIQWSLCCRCISPGNVRKLSIKEKFKLKRGKYFFSFYEYSYMLMDFYRCIVLQYVTYSFQCTNCLNFGQRKSLPFGSCVLCHVPTILWALLYPGTRCSSLSLFLFLIEYNLHIIQRIDLKCIVKRFWISVYIYITHVPNKDIEYFKHLRNFCRALVPHMLHHHIYLTSVLISTTIH